MTKQIPITKNQIIELEISNMGHEGQGIGRYQGFAVFVPEAISGEYVRVKVIKLQKNYAVAKLLDIIESIEQNSKQETNRDKNLEIARVVPRCEIATRCGGCQLQHLEYQSQLLFKQKVVQDNLQRIAGVNISSLIVKPTLGMDKPWHYRNKAQVPVGENTANDSNKSIKKQELISGFYAQRSHQIIAFDNCYIQHPLNNQLVQLTREVLQDYGVTAYNELTHSGLVRHIIARTAFTTNEVMLIIVINEKLKGKKSFLPQQNEIVAVIEERASKLTISKLSININFNNKRTNTIMGEQTYTIAGPEKIIDYIGDLKFAISARSFYQVNPQQTEVLYNKALEYAELTGVETVVDAYCGIGTISLMLAQKAKKVYGVEIVAEAIADANYNAQLNNIKNVEFVTARAEQWLPQLQKELAKTNEKIDVIVVDPPRKGCDQELLETILQLAPERIVYVSCNPSTLARDIKFLMYGDERLASETKYEVTVVQAVDMFPQTAHVECVVKLERR